MKKVIKVPTGLKQTETLTFWERREAYSPQPQVSVIGSKQFFCKHLKIDLSSWWCLFLAFLKPSNIRESEEDVPVLPLIWGIKFCQRSPKILIHQYLFLRSLLRTYSGSVSSKSTKENLRQQLWIPSFLFAKSPFHQTVCFVYKSIITSNSFSS